MSCNMGQALDEIEEAYIREALKDTQRTQRKNRKRKKQRIIVAALVSMAACTGLFLLIRGMLPENAKEEIAVSDRRQESAVNGDVISQEKHLFSLTVYAAPNDQGVAEKTIMKENEEYTLVSEGSAIVNKLYNLGSDEAMPEDMIDGIETDPFLHVFYGFNLSVEGEDIEQISFQNLDGTFAQKVEYDWSMTREQKQAFFEEHPDCYGVGEKESATLDGDRYEYCGDKEIRNWAFIPAGEQYAVPYEEQGNGDYLYSLQVKVARSDLEHAREEDEKNGNFDSSNRLAEDALTGIRIRVTATFKDGSTGEKIVEITGSTGRSVKIRLEDASSLQ